MLIHLRICHFTIIDHIELDITAGMTVLTGETGVGKSIVLDALALCLGQRADTRLIRQDQSQCDISAQFDLQTQPSIQQWLASQDLYDETICTLRRIVTKEGRSRCYINGHAVSLQLLAQLGEQLLSIHGQHDQQHLLHRDNHRLLLDTYAQHATHLADIKALYQRWQTLHQQWQQHQNTGNTAEQALLSYQVQELAALNLTEGEIESLEKTMKRLQSSAQLQQICHQLLTVGQTGDEPIEKKLFQLLSLLNGIITESEALTNSHHLLNQSLIYIQEAMHEITAFQHTIEENPEQLQQVMTRLDKLHDIARKHKVPIKMLHTHYQILTDQLATIEKRDVEILRLEKEKTDLEKSYRQMAAQLSESRQQSAVHLANIIQEKIRMLGMPNAEFRIQCTSRQDEKVHSLGHDTIEFYVRMNPGQPFAPLSKVASGGELSRVSLAIHVVLSVNTMPNTLIFDEIDTGIGGSTAAIVGQTLKQLSEKTQVLCVTHLPQVAAFGQQHYRIQKHIKNNQTHVTVDTLSTTEKIEEIARMLGGVKITAQTRAHAAELCRDAMAIDQA